MGMNQKQAVATLYMVAAVLGLCAVMVVSSGYVKLILSIAALGGTAYTVTRIARYPHDHPKPPAEAAPDADAGPDAGTDPGAGKSEIKKEP